MISGNQSWGNPKRRNYVRSFKSLWGIYQIKKKNNFNSPRIFCIKGNGTDINSSAIIGRIQ